MRKFLFAIIGLFICLPFLEAQVVLYGLTSGGGNGSGTIIKYESATNTLQAVYAFNTNDGINPHGSLVRASDGKLYGMTSGGGAYGYGTIFSYDPVSAAFTRLYDFDGVNGAEPNGSLIQAADGKLYGMTTFGGAYNRGTIFSFQIANAGFSKLHDFEVYNGRFPYGSLTEGPDGKLYGMTSDGGVYCTSYCGGDGIAFSFNPADNIFTKVQQFYGYSYPYGSYLLASNGLLYSTNSSGGSSGCGNPKGGDGAITGFSPLSLSYNVFTQFYSPLSIGSSSSKGRNPNGDLIEAKDGQLYGVTSSGGNMARCGGPIGNGVIFSYDTAAKVITNKYDFTAATGTRPNGSLMQASDGNLYGMTSEGGSKNSGVIFSYNLENGAYAKLQDFTGENGAGPWYGKLTEVKLCSTPVATADSVSTVCEGSTLTLHAGGGKTYSWSGPGQFTTTWQSPVISNVTAANAGVYTVTVSNGEGCSAKASTTVTVNPLPKVSIPDALALRIGVDPNTVYIGFSPASSITLNALVPDRSAGIKYNWSTGARTSAIRVNPTASNTYTVTATDAAGCSQSASKKINVVDVRCGNKLNKVSICSAPSRKSGKVKESCVDPLAAAIEIALGSHLGSCGGNSSDRELNDKITDDKKDQLTLTASPNPTTNYFKINVTSNNTKNDIYIRVLDKVGRLLEVMSIKNSQTLTIGSTYSAGAYFVEAVQGTERATVKLIKQ